MNKEDFKALILEGISSQEQLKVNAKFIREELARQNKETTKCYLDVIFHVLQDKKAESSTRFYALFSLKTVTETSIPSLLLDLFSRSSYLKFLQDQATFDKDKSFPERGSKILTPKPTDKEKSAGSNYLALLLEMIKYWDLKYGSTDKGKDNAPRALYKKLSSNLKVPFPETFNLYKTMSQSQTSEQNKTVQQSQNPKQSQNEMEISFPAASSGDLKKSLNPIVVSTKEKENDPVRSAQEKLNLLKSLKLKLKGVYEQNKEAEPRGLKQYYDEMSSVSKQLSDLLIAILNDSSTKNEMLVDEILQQNQQLELLSKEYEKYSSKKSKWQKHRVTVLVIFGASGMKGTTGGLDPLQQIFAEARKVNAPVIKFNASKLNEDDDQIEMKEEQKGNIEQDIFGRFESIPKKEEKKEKEKENVAAEVNKKPEMEQNPEKILSKEELKKINDQKLLAEARKTEAALLQYNASELYEDADYAEVKEEKKSKGRGEEIEESRKVGRVTEFMNDEETSVAEIKPKTQSRGREGEIGESRKAGKVTELRKEEAPIAEEKPKTQSKLEERPKNLENSSKNERYEEKKAVFDQKEKSVRSEYAGQISQLPRNVQNSEVMKGNPKAVSSQSNQDNTQKRIIEEKKVHDIDPSVSSIPLTQSLTIMHQKTMSREEKTSNPPRGMFQTLKLDQSAVTQKFASELKLMELSIKTTRNRSQDLENIKEGIKQSFVNRNRKPPKYRDLFDQGLLNNLENKIEQLKTSKLPVSTEDQAQTSSTALASKQKMDSELVQQTLNLQKQCGDYQKEVEKVSKENVQLKSDLQQIHSTLATLNARSVPLEQVEELKNNNHTLLRQVKQLEDQLKIIQLQSPRSESKIMFSSREPQESQSKKQEQSNNRTPVQPENEDSEGHENRRSARSENLTISSKHELFDGRDRLVHEIVINSPTRSYAHQRVSLISPISQKTSSIDTGNYFQQKGTRSPKERLFNSAGVSNREEIPSIKTGNRYHVENTLESDIEQDVSSILGKQVASEHYVLKELKLRLGVVGNTLHQFKIACLKSKSLLFENDIIQIGLTTNLVQGYGGSKNVLKLMIYYSNKLKEDIMQFRVSLTEGLNLNVMTKPDLYEAILPSDKQLKQQFLISFISVPFNCLQLNCTGVLAGTRANFNFPLPNLLSKFMEFKYIDLSGFRARWKILENQIVKTEPIALNNELINKAADFKNYFAYLIDVGSVNEVETTPRNTGMKFGGLFELEMLNVDYLLKINVLPTSEVVFQIATAKENQALATYLLQTLIFMFRR